MPLFADRIGFGYPACKIGVEVFLRMQAKMVQVITR